MTKVLQSRPYQERIVAKAVKAYSDLHGRTKEAAAVMVEAPTGSGKTCVAMKVIQNLLLDSQRVFGKPNKDVIVNWCAMRSNLLKQAREENEEMFGIPNVNYVSMFDKEPPKCDFLVFDECQHSCTNSAVDIYIRSEPKATLGLSATPYRVDRQKLCFHKSIRDAGYRQLIHDGWLSPFNQFMLPDWTVETVVKAYLREPQRWGKTAVYFLTLEDCYQAAEMVKRAGIKADVVTGTSPREAQLDAFEDGKIDILFNVFVLSEGWDCPTLNTVFCRPSSRGPTTQMCGRAFRKIDGKIANIVQSNNTKTPFARIATPVMQYVLDTDLSSWRTIGKNDNVEKCFMAMRLMVLKTQVDIPEMLKRNFGRDNIEGQSYVNDNDGNHFRHGRHSGRLV